jgi:Uma2 family endonuclease
MSTFTYPKIHLEPGVAPPRGLRMSEEEFQNWRDETVKAEWVEGEVIVMAPSNFEHQDLNMWLLALLRLYVERKKLGVVASDYFIRLLKPRRQFRVPDLLFVSSARRDLLKSTRMEGAPDLIIEIISPDSGSRDWREKFFDYQAAGVREYWIVDPMAQTVEAHVLEAAGNYVRLEEKDQKIASTIVTGWYIRHSWLWQEQRPDVLDVLRELGIQ